jgi:two-component system OmpR family response regulator
MNLPEHIIVVDDDKEIRTLLSEFLAMNGYQISIAKDGSELMELFKQNSNISLIILDIMLPGPNGLELCRQIRHTSRVPILMLSAAGDTVDRIIGLEFGADDYLTKPFNPRELLARIKAILRRIEHRPNGLLANTDSKPLLFKFSNWQLDTASRRLISPQGIEVSLSGRGYDLLLIFLEHPQRVLSRDQLLDLLANRSAEPFDRSIDIQVSRLRQKLGDDSKNPAFIKTIRTGGYLFTPLVTRE